MTPKLLSTNRHKRPLCNHPECQRIAAAFGTDAACYVDTYAGEVNRDPKI
jgi:hypothetical protein